MRWPCIVKPSRAGRLGCLRAWPVAGGVVALMLILQTARPARAGERRFTYVYESVTLPKGALEYEQWVTWKTAKQPDRQVSRFELRHEVEYGLTDHLQFGLYVSDWSYEKGRERVEFTMPNGETATRTEGFSKGQWDSISLEVINSFTDPVTDPVGIALYGEIKGGDDIFALEGKLLLQKNFGAWEVAYNAAIEAEWQGHRIEEDNGEFQQSAGLSYQFSPNLTAGVELLHELGIPDWAGIRGKPELFLGPNVSYRAKKWWATLTPLWQVSRNDEAEDFQIRLIVGFNVN